MNSELKPCPFCGGEMIDDGTEECGAFYHKDPDAARMKKCPLVVQHFKSRTEATEAWNTRAERTCEGCEHFDSHEDYINSPCMYCARRLMDLYESSCGAKVVE